MESAVTDILEEELSTVAGPAHPGQLERGAVQQHHAGVHARPRRRRCRAGRARQGVPRARAAAARHRGAGHRQAGGRRLSRSSGWRSTGRTTPCSSCPTSPTGWSRASCRPCPGVGSVFICGRAPLRHAGLALGQRSWRRAGSRCRTSSRPSARRNVEVPAGRIESNRREFTVRSLGELKTPAEFGDLVVASQGGQLVKLKDLGHVELGAEDERSALRFKGAPDGRPGRGAAVEGQPHHRGRRRPRGRCPRIAGLAAARRQPRRRLRRVDLRQALHPRGAGDAGPRGDPGRAHHLRLPAKRALHDHPGPRDPGVDRRRPSRSCTSSASPSTT